jgi:hypothetical protein
LNRLLEPVQNREFWRYKRQNSTLQARKGTFTYTASTITFDVDQISFNHGSTWVPITEEIKQKIVDNGGDPWPYPFTNAYTYDNDAGTCSLTYGVTYQKTN